MNELTKNYKFISDGLERHTADLNSLGYSPLLIAVHGSQNYDLAYENSDIDTKAIIMPSLGDIISGQRPVSTTYIRENEEQIDMKDIRVYFNQFWKQNINFLEILFTPYIVARPSFFQFWEKITEVREEIAHFHTSFAVKAMCGMAWEKFNDLEHPYPTVKWKIQKWGYDGKQLHHILRLEEFLRSYIEGETFAKCLVNYPKYGRDYLLAAKKNEFCLSEARQLATESIRLIDRMKEEYVGLHIIKVNEEIKKYVDAVLYDVFVYYITEESSNM